MNNNKKRRIEPWRVIVGIISIGYITYMWAKKDIIGFYSTLPKEQALPLIATTVVVSLIKVIAIAGGLFLIQWIIAKIKNGKDS